MDFEKTFIGRPNTLRTYKGLYRNHIKDLFTNEQINNWKPEYLNIAVNTWLDEELSPNTIESLIRVLSKYLKFNGLNIDTSEIIKKIKRLHQQPKVNALNFQESEILMKECLHTDLEYYPILLLGLHAGLRRGEVFGLTTNDIDILKNQLLIQRSYDGPTKSGKSRTVPISAELNEFFVKRNYIIGENRKLFKVFDPNPKLHKLCDRARIKKITFHDLRHTFATLALEHPVSPKAVQLWLGHKSLKTTP